MSTLDLIEFYGGKAANFLDVGGGAESERVMHAVRLVASVPSVKVIVVNLLGGITKCDEVAKGIIAAGIPQKVIVRLCRHQRGRGEGDCSPKKATRCWTRWTSWSRRPWRWRHDLRGQEDRRPRAGRTGKQGEFHIGLMNAYARQVGGRGVVAGVTPGKGGQEVHGVPVYNTVKEAMREHDIGAAVIFVPAAAAADSIMEEANAGIRTIVCITEHIPVHDTMKAIAYARMEGAA